MPDYCLSCGDKIAGEDKGEYHTFYNDELDLEASLWICEECVQSE